MTGPHTSPRLRTTLFGALVAVGLAAPALASPSRDHAPPLPVEGLQQRDHSGLDRLFLRPGANLGAYNQVLVAPVRVDVKEPRDRDALILRERDREHAAEYFQGKLVQQLDGRLAQQPGPGVLRLDIAVTEFVPNSPVMPKKRFGGYMLDSYGVGAAAFQGTLTDTQTGQVVAAFSDEDVGAPFTTNLLVNTEYGDADSFMRRWARQLTELLVTSPVG